MEGVLREALHDVFLWKVISLQNDTKVLKISALLGL